MTKKIKCTNCGSKNLIKHKFLIKSVEIPASFDEDVFACKQCGHLEWFLKEETIASLIEREEREANYNRELAKFEIERAKLQKQIDDLIKIISDENQTVKSVNQAKEKKAQLEEKMSGLYPPVPF